MSTASASLPAPSTPFSALLSYRRRFPSSEDLLDRGAAWPGARLNATALRAAPRLRLQGPRHERNRPRKENRRDDDPSDAWLRHLPVLPIPLSPPMASATSVSPIQTLAISTTWPSPRISKSRPPSLLGHASLAQRTPSSPKGRAIRRIAMRLYASTAAFASARERCDGV